MINIPDITPEQKRLRDPRIFSHFYETAAREVMAAYEHLEKAFETINDCEDNWWIKGEDTPIEMEINLEEFDQSRRDLANLVQGLARISKEALAQAPPKSKWPIHRITHAPQISLAMDDLHDIYWMRHTKDETYKRVPPRKEDEE
jgi:hypothetical protein